MIVQAIRSLLFYVLFFLHTLPLAILVGLMARLAPRRRDLGWAIALYWNAANLFLLRWVAGIRTEVTGAGHIPEGGCIIAAKHMSDWDIFAILPHTTKPAFIAKRQLLDIPLFGWAARWLHTIPVDRSKGKLAMTAMMGEARKALDKDCQIIIFPEGTRKAPLEPPAYRPGILRMYRDLGVPVVPVALTSGLYWGRNSLVLWPGTARARFLPPIPPGLAMAEFERAMIEAIETETGRMLAEDFRTGLARPIPPALREKLMALESPSPSDKPQ